MDQATILSGQIDAAYIQGCVFNKASLKLIKNRQA